MDPTRPPASGPGSEFRPENRAQSVAIALSVFPDPVGAVTVGRAGGVVQPSTGRLTYEVDSAGHRVVARYQDGTIAFAFGSYGRRPGQFDCPLHVVTIWPEFSGEPVSQAGRAVSLFTPWLAVADYGNHRVQFFECDGAWLGESELDPAQPPCQLAWRAPALEIDTLDGRRLRIHVAAALLAPSRQHREYQRPGHSDPRHVWRVC